MTAASTILLARGVASLALLAEITGDRQLLLILAQLRGRPGYDEDEADGEEALMRDDLELDELWRPISLANYPHRGEA